VLQELDRVQPGATPIRRRKYQSQMTPSNSSQGEVESVESFCAELVGGELSQRLFSVVEKINAKFPQLVGRQEEEEENIFPTLPGSHLKLTFPALQFVKSVCKVLSLDPSIKDQVGKMRRNLLKLISVGEFDKIADWVDPCISFTLAEVICRSCNHCRDIDLCKDPHTSTNQEGRHVWICSNQQCKASYDMMELESKLIDALQRKMMAYSLQDLACSKCRQVTQYNMLRRCGCAGSWTHTQPDSDTKQLLETLRGIALHYTMPLLMEQVDWTEEMNKCKLK